MSQTFIFSVSKMELKILKIVNFVVLFVFFDFNRNQVPTMHFITIHDIDDVVCIQLLWYDRLNLKIIVHDVKRYNKSLFYCMRTIKNRIHKRGLKSLLSFSNMAV